MNNQKRIYLACPYTHENPQIMRERAYMATHTTAELMQEGHSVFSPITQGHEVCKYGIGHTFEAWKETDLSIIRFWATDVYVCTMKGYTESTGVKAEVEFAKQLGVPVYYMHHGLFLNFTHE